MDSVESVTFEKKTMRTESQKHIQPNLEVVKSIKSHTSQILRNKPDDASRLSGLIYRNAADEEVIVYLEDRQKVNENFSEKYKNSPLDQSDIKRISNKISLFLSQTENIVDRNLNLSLLSQKIGERKHHISQSLSEYFKTSFNNLLNAERINISKKLLVDSSYNNLTLYGIALEAGFNSKSTFNRAFLKFVKMTPSLYKMYHSK